MAKKFVIIAQPRTGSSMLVNSLNELSDFNVYGELFARTHTMKNTWHPQEVQDQMIKRYIRNSYDLSGKKTVKDFLDKIYTSHRLNVGFKLLTPHLSRDEKEQIIDYIQSNGIYKILLFRENKIKQVISARTNKQEDKCHIDSVPFLMSRVKYFIRDEKEIKDIFANGKYVIKTYEELTNEEDIKTLNIKWLLNFFGLNCSGKRINVPLRKYRPSKVSDNVSNFGTLASHIKNKEPQFLKWIT